MKISLEEQLSSIIKHTTNSFGGSFFDNMTRSLAKAVGADYCFIACVDELLTKATTISVFAKGQITDGFEYDLHGTPCAEVTSDGIDIYSENVIKEFPDDHLLQAMKVEAYIGTSLINSEGRVIGLVSALFEHPINQPEPIHLLFQFFSSWIATEVERTEKDLELTNLNKSLRQKVLDRTEKLEFFRSQSEIDQAHFRAIIETAAEAIITTDTRDLIKSFNAAASNLFGYTADEIIGKNVSILMTEPYSSSHNDYIQKQLETGVDKITDTGRQIEARHKNGNVLPIHIAISRIETSEIIGFTAIIHDLTTEKERENQLIRLKNEADEANLAKSKFLTNMSHELRTPLNAIIGFSQLLELDDNLTRKQTDNIGEIIMAGNHLLALINDILDLAKVESGQYELSMEPVNVCSIIQECIKLSEIIARKRGIVIRYKGLQECFLLVDSLRLKQALLNLISNAIKYNQDDGIVEISAEFMDNHLRIYVSDTGPGIPPEKQHELFKPFSRLQAENSGIEGTGIGLALTRQIIELMGGTIGFDSKAGAGSTFWIKFPTAEEPAAKKTPS